MISVNAVQPEQKTSTQEMMENQLLEWFAGLRLNLREQRLSIGDFEYINFSAFKKMPSGGYLSSHGRSTSRRTAAIKCAAEMIERQFMLDSFQATHHNVTAPDSIEAQALPQKDFWTSNGWAVHFDKNTSQRKSLDEALERHLLLKSFLNSQWQGFNPAHQIKSSEIELYFYSSQFSLKEKVAGMVIAKSPLYEGVSFGYCLGSKSDITQLSFWENAIFEAIDKILTLKGNSVDLSQSPDSWIAAHTKEFLETPFDLDALNTAPLTEIKDSIPEFFVKTFDLAEKWNLPFPFFASFTWGGNLIPLFDKASLTPMGTQHLESVLALNGLSKRIPERHPIL